MNSPIAKLFLPLNQRRRGPAAQLSAALDNVVSQVNSQAQGVGAVLASSSTIVLTAAIHHVSGTAAIKTITPPANFSGPAYLIPDGAWTLVTGGNIKLAATAVVGKAMTLIFDGSNWFPHYVA